MTRFEACKAVPSSQVARHAGIELQSDGNRAWAICPLHNEKTPSLLFDASGRWHCFGCNKGGDAVDLYAALYGVSAIEAAAAVMQISGKTYKDLAVGKISQQPALPAERLKEIMTSWRKREWDRACIIKHEASRRIEMVGQIRESCLLEGGSFDVPDELFQFVEAKAAANQRLDDLDNADIFDLLDMITEETDDRK